MGASFSPLDEQLGLLPGRWSPHLQQLIVMLGTLTSFGQVPALLTLISKVSISRSSVRRLTEHSGAALAARQEAEAHRIRTMMPPNPPGPARQQVSVDGAMVPIVGGEWREVKTMVIGDLDAGTPGHAGQLSYCSRIVEADRFADLATTELHRRGTFGAETVVGIADGAVWCQQFYAYHVPNAIRILDFPHAAEQLSRAAQACWGPGVDADTWSTDQRADLRAGKATAVIAAVTALSVAQAPNPTDATTTVRQVARYLQERLPQLAYADFVAAGYPIGSGAVESANKLVVEARLKGAGRHWTVDNANAMLALRGALCSQRWDEEWRVLSSQRRAIAHRSNARPTSPAVPSVSPASPSKPTLSRHRVAKISMPSPYFTDGKPNQTHPWKRQGLRRPEDVPRQEHLPNTEM